MTHRLAVVQRSRKGEKTPLAAHNPVDEGVEGGPTCYQKAWQEANTFVRKKKGTRDEKSECKNAGNNT